MNFFRPLHTFIRTHLPQAKRLLAAALLAALLGLWMHASGQYPPYWDAAMTGLTLLAGLWSPLAAWWLAGLIGLYGLYAFSFYLAVLWMCVLILAQRPASRHLALAALLLAAPFLTRWHLGWLPLLLGGLYLGHSGGAWLGALSALWGMMVAAAHGYMPDWLTFAAAPWQAELVAARFTGLNSWRTLYALIEPLAPNSTALLYHLLQVGVWMGAGMLVGYAVQKASKGGRPTEILPITLGGAASLGILQGLLALWLGVHPWGWFVSQKSSLLLPMLIAPLAATWLDILRDFFGRPLPPAPSHQKRSNAPLVSPQISPNLLPKSPKPEKNDDESDLIMLELD
ncbi:MAG: hypothetical protein Fur0018_19970 [Anaerolineales bacterium]